MERLFTQEAAETEVKRGRGHGDAKNHGIHYTPPDLAEFVARRVLARMRREECVVLDPACGDGELLVALASEAARHELPAPQLFGVDRDPAALAIAKERVSGVQSAKVTLHCGEFLTLGTDRPSVLPAAYDVVISNPPYVRTQVLGATRAQALGREFGLTGRVDLYHAFVAAMTASLHQDGVLGLLCSNRFLTTKGGHSLRSMLLSHYELQELWDLGDTKLFEAAVLPAVVVARRSSESKGANLEFVRVYENESARSETVEEATLLGALDGGVEGPVQIGGRNFNIERGSLAEPSPERPWQLSSPAGTRWLNVVRRHSAGRFGDLGSIRVGIKTTADNVFIRPSWDDLPEELRPEAELLHPLLTHRVASRWLVGNSSKGARFVLYPHEIRESRRRAIDLQDFPRAAAYLAQHRARLEGRSYVRKAGRAWYEIWVPQQPDAWPATKLVWPDISHEPRFFLDETGSIVNGDCYWLSCIGLSNDQIALALAVANSSVALRYYDLCCGNRLYAGRRRFITQYVEELPIPEASAAQQRDIANMVRELQAGEVDAKAFSQLEADLDSAVTELFGVKEVPGES